MSPEVVRPIANPQTHRQEEEEEKDWVVEFPLLGLHDRSILLIPFVVPLWNDWSWSTLVAIAIGRLRWVWGALSIWS